MIIDGWKTLVAESNDLLQKAQETNDPEALTRIGFLTEQRYAGGKRYRERGVQHQEIDFVHGHTNGIEMPSDTTIITKTIQLNSRFGQQPNPRLFEILSQSPTLQAPDPSSPSAPVLFYEPRASYLTKNAPLKHPNGKNTIVPSSVLQETGSTK
jgi:hypothetical protein